MLMGIEKVLYKFVQFQQFSRASQYFDIDFAHEKFGSHICLILGTCAILKYLFINIYVVYDLIYENWDSVSQVNGN